MTVHHSLVVLVLGAAAVLAACSSAVAPSGEATAGATAGAVASLPAAIPVAEANRLREAGAFVLDVRQPDEWAAGHIPEATLIPLGDLRARVADVPKDRQVVVVCRSGNRSAQGRDILLAAGYPAVTSMAGGMNEWTASGLPTTIGD